jgi:hydroxypyruvate reductase
VARYRLEARLPHSILRAIKLAAQQKATGSQRSLRKHYVLLDNSVALDSAAEAARERGFLVETARDVVEQPIEAGCAMLLERLLDLRRRQEGRAVCLLSGGEFACPVRGPGEGGRNAESALRWAIEFERLAEAQAGDVHFVALSAGTDGVDGNSPAAGAVADETSTLRARVMKMDARTFLDESNAYAFFQALNDAIVIGPAGTNVRDLRVLLAG